MDKGMNKNMNLGQMIDRMYAIKLEIGEINQSIKPLQEESDALTARILETLNTIGVKTGKANTASATISTSVVPNVVDWDAFYSYIVETNQPFLLERRPSVIGFRDLLAAEGSIPGVEPFTKVGLSLRKL